MMKYRFVCILLVCALGLQAQKKTIVTGYFKGKPTDTITSGLRTDETIKGEVGADGGYRYELELDGPAEVLIWAEPNKTRESLYLMPGDNLVVRYDIYHQDSTITFSGKGAAANKLLKKYNRMEGEEFSKLNFSVNTTANEMYGYLKKLYQRRMTFLQKEKKNLPPSLYSSKEIDAYASYAGGSMQTPVTMQGYLGKKVLESIPDGYWEAGKLFRQNKKWLGNRSYDNFLAHAYPYFLLMKQQHEKNALEEKIPREERYRRMYAIAKEVYKDKDIRSVALAGMLEAILQSTADASKEKALVDEFLAKDCQNEITRDKITSLYRKVAATSVGQEPPYFTLKDESGKDISLADFKGKVVYMDFWASWCSPCRYEMKNNAPALHHKFENSKEVVFLFISIDDSEDKWKQAIKEDNIKGIHLLSKGGFSSKVAEIFNLNGVPHYMMIGKDGKIIDNNAPRPGDPKTAAMIDKAIN